VQVELVREKRTGRACALKKLSKSQLINMSASVSFWEERFIMAETKSDWIVKLHHAYQDPQYLFLVMEYVPGGDLVTLMSKYTPFFSEDAARFYIAETILAVETVHALGFAHRDLKVSVALNLHAVLLTSLF
jgi:serine/threonine protein kinase